VPKIVFNREVNYWAVINTCMRPPQQLVVACFLEFTNVKLHELPDSIVKLHELRYLDIGYTNVKSIPMCFSSLTSLRLLVGFPTYMDGDWCSLEEIGPLSQFTMLGLNGLENVSTTSSIAKVE
jgi:Leucine-rich repeat (LRR) protein